MESNELIAVLRQELASLMRHSAALRQRAQFALDRFGRYELEAQAMLVETVIHNLKAQIDASLTAGLARFGGERLSDRVGAENG